MVIKLVSGAGTGFFYIFKKTPNLIQKKMAVRKFDPIVNQHVIFNEAKLKYSTAAYDMHPEATKMSKWATTFSNRNIYQFKTLSNTLTSSIYSTAPIMKRFAVPIVSFGAAYTFFNTYGLNYTPSMKNFQ